MQDQRNKADAGKPKLAQLFAAFNGPISALADPICAVAAVLKYGAEKYERDGWKTVEPGRYEDALCRHVTAALAGEKYDEETGLSHLAHAATNCLFLLWFQMRANPWHCFFKYNKPPQDHKK